MNQATRQVLKNMESLTEAHSRAIDSLVGAIDYITEEQADEIVTSFSSLIFETLRNFLDQNDSTH